MRQPHTEYGVRHTDDQQNTGNHRKRSGAERRAGRLGGTRTGAEHVEPVVEPRQTGETLHESGATVETEQ